MPRGFAALTPERRREIASMGGKTSAGFAKDPERARSAGRKGGQNSSGNFKHNPERAQEMGRRGGSAPKPPRKARP
jgi:general stress protein YciG